jgi:hypothetical protein
LQAEAHESTTLEDLAVGEPEFYSKVESVLARAAKDLS